MEHWRPDDHGDGQVDNLELNDLSSNEILTPRVEVFSIQHHQSLSSGTGYHPSPNFHPLKSPAEIQSPLSICSPTFLKSTLFRTPPSELRMLGKKNKRFANRARLDMEEEGPSSSSKAKKLTANEQTILEERSIFDVENIHQKSIIFANLPLLDRLAPHEDSFKYVLTDDVIGERAHNTILKRSVDSRVRSRSMGASEAYKTNRCKTDPHEFALKLSKCEHLKPADCFNTNDLEKGAYHSPPVMSHIDSSRTDTIDCNTSIKQSSLQHDKEDNPTQSSSSKDINAVTGYEDTAHLTSIAVTLLKMATGE